MQLKSLFATLAAVSLLALADAKICTQEEVDVMRNCGLTCCWMIIIPIYIPSCIYCQAVAKQNGYLGCVEAGQPPREIPEVRSSMGPRNPPHTPSNRIKKRSLEETCPSRRELYDKVAKGTNSFNRSAFYKQAKAGVLIDRKTHSEAFDLMDANGDGQVTFDEMVQV